MGRPRQTDPAVIARQLQRRVVDFLTRAGRPVARSQLHSNMHRCSWPALRAALETLASQGVLKHTTRREPFVPNVPGWEVDRDYWELTDRISEHTDGA